MDKTTLLKTVSYFFEAESNKLNRDINGNPEFKIEDWERIRDVLHIANIPHEKPRCKYSTISTAYASSALVEINEKIVEKKLKNVICIEFHSLYPHIIIALTHQEIISYDKDLPLLQFLVENYEEIQKLVSPYAAKAVKSWINFYFGVKFKKEKSAPILGAAHLILSKVQKSIGENYFYLDTDSVFFHMPKDITKFVDYMNYVGFPYEVKQYEGAIFFAKKKYILMKETAGVKISGFKPVTF